MPVEDGDVLRSDGTRPSCCDGWICEAWISEFGDIDGYAGDQTGGEVRCACSYLNHLTNRCPMDAPDQIRRFLLRRG